MRALFASELRRFRTLALVLALVHLGVLGVAASGDDLYLPAPSKLALGAVLYALTGLLLGLYQIASYRRGDLWIHLLHRPLAPSRCFLALGGAAALALAFAVALPLLLIALLLGAGGGDLDARHLLLAPSLWVVSLSFYLAGVLLALKPWRGTPLVAALALVSLVPCGTGVWTLLPQLCVLLWLATLAARAFRPDLSCPPRGPLAVAAAVPPVALALYLLCSFGVLAGYSLWVGFTEENGRLLRFRWNDYFPEGSYLRTTYMDPPEALAHGLRLGGSPPPGLRRGAEPEGSRHRPVDEIAPLLRSFPARHQPTYQDRDLVLDDPAHRTRWTFRHDRMLFAGRGIRSGRDEGWLGPAGPASSLEDGAPRFQEVPYSFDAGQILTPRRLYRFDSASRRVQLRLALPAGERFVAPARAGAISDLALSSRALYLFAPGALLGESPGQAGPAIPLAVVPLGDSSDNLDRALVAPVAAGHLVSFVFGRRSERELAPARQTVRLIAANGLSAWEIDQVLTQGLPAFVRHRGYLISPMLQAVEDLIRAAAGHPADGALSLAEFLAHPPPRSLQLGAALLAVLAGAVTWMLARRRRLSGIAQSSWSAAGLLLGIPGLLTFLLLTPPPDG